MPVYHEHASYNNPAIPPIRRDIWLRKRGEGREADGGFLGVCLCRAILSGVGGQLVVVGSFEGAVGFLAGGGDGGHSRAEGVLVGAASITYFPGIVRFGGEEEEGVIWTV